MLSLCAVLCKNPTEEPLHWLVVADLHKSWYHPPNAGLFVIPKPTAQPTEPTQVSKSTRAASQQALPDPQSPSKASIASSAPATPSSVVTASDRGPQVFLFSVTKIRMLIVCTHIVAAQTAPSFTLALARPHREYLSHIPQALHGQRSSRETTAAAAFPHTSSAGHSKRRRR